MTNAVNLASVAGNGFYARNRIINGAMEIDQRNAGASVNNVAAGTGVYTLDRWLAYGTGATKFAVQQNGGGVTPPAGFSNYLGVTSASSYSVPAGELYYITQRVEGLNVYDLAWGTASASTVTLSFWARSSLAGTFGGALNNSAGNRSYPFTYTINSANTWEYKTITIPGDTSGTWLTTNGIGVQIVFGLGVGSTYSGTAGSWSGSTFLSATGATSVVGTNGATFYLTGVQLEVGSVATPFERRLYPQEFAMCQRYYQVIGSGALGRYGSSTSCELFWITSIPLRTAPTVAATTNAANLFRVGLASGTTSTFSAASNGGTSKGGCWIVTFSGGVSPSAGEFAALVTDAVSLSAEL